MLEVGRKEGEKVILGDNEVVITVKRVSGKNVRLQFDAPKEIAVNREEIYDGKCAEGNRPPAILRREGYPYGQELR